MKLGAKMIDDTENYNERAYPLHEIYFYLTDDCNLACRHCWIEPRYGQDGKTHSIIPIKLMESIIGQAKQLGLRSAKLTGGEPLLHPQMQEIIELMRKEDIEFHMETNGILCTKEMANDIAKTKNPSISVSIDGSNAKTHEWIRGVPGCFDAALNGLRNLADAGLKPQVIMTLMRKNAEQIEELVRLVEGIGAGSIKFNLLQPSGRGESMHKGDEVLTVQELTSIGAWVENKLVPSTELRIIFDHPMAFSPLGRLFRDGQNGCSRCGICSILGVLADGSYALCGIGKAVPEMIFGHAANDRLEDVWKGSKILRSLRSGLPDNLKGVCGECMMKNICLGKCIAQNYYSSKDLWAPYWYCEDARKAGIFPQNRLAKITKNIISI
jgi:SynChlorMet cassette radical SAM/SPASM protein ScmF